MNEKMKRKKGFTLIELLAVIVILAIIALIAIPNIIKILNKTRLSAAIDSAYGILSSAETYVANQMLLNKDSNISDLTFEANDGKVCANENDCLSFKGTKPSSGYVYILNNGSNFVLENLVINGFTCNKPIFEDKVTCEKEEIIEIVDENEGIICGDSNTEDYDNLKECYIKSIADYEEFTDLVNSGKSFSGKTVYLSKNLDLNGVTLEPIGNNNNKFEGTFEGNGYTLKNIKIESVANYVGMFGYNKGTIRGFNVENISVKGNNNVGGIAGYNIGTINSISLTGTIEGNSTVGGIAGHSEKILSNVLLRDVSVKAKDTVGGITGYAVSGTSSGIIENGSITGENYINCSNGRTYYAGNYGAYCSNKVKINESLNTSGYDVGSDMLTYYNSYLDTIYGGDNDSDGYYFNYDNKGILKVVTTKEYPVEFNLKGSGTQEDPYQIKSVNDFNNAAINLTTERASAYYSLMNDIDFKDKKVYILGLDTISFNGTFEGNGCTLKNIKIESVANYVGMFGYNKGTIRGFNVENISVKGNNNVGGIAGYNIGTINSISLTGTIEGNSTVGGIAGHSEKILSNVLLRDVSVKAKDTVGGITGYAVSGTSSGIIENGSITGENYINCSNGRTYYAGNYGAYCSNKVKINESLNTSGYDVGSDMLTYYNSYLDTIYGGDNDSDGYYFNYDNKGILKVVTTKEYPVEFNLKGSGTQENPYQIKSVNDFNNAAINQTTERASSYYSLMNDIDFKDKKVYSFGLESVPFTGTFIGNGYTLKNIKIDATTDYVGIFGYNKGTIRGFNVENISVKGKNYVGGIAGYNLGNIESMIVTGSVFGNSTIGGIAGNSQKVIKNILLKNIFITGNDTIGGITGYAVDGTSSGIVENGSITGENYTNCSNGRTYYPGKYGAYCSSDTTINGVNVTGSNVIDLTKVTDFNATYKTYLDTESDSDSDGYYFIYDSNKKSMILKKS